MTLYDRYVERPRNRLGVQVKRFQAAKLFSLGLPDEPRSEVRILEIGPGDGYIADLAVRYGYRCVAVEDSETITAALRAL